MKQSHLVTLIAGSLCFASISIWEPGARIDAVGEEIQFQWRGPRRSKANVVVVAIDDKTEAAWEAPKAFWAGEVAKVTSECLRRGAAKVGIDLIFAVDVDSFLTSIGSDSAPNSELDNVVSQARDKVFLGTSSGDDLVFPLGDVSDGRTVLSLNSNQSDRSVVRLLPRLDSSLDPVVRGFASGLAGEVGDRRDPIDINYSGSQPTIVSAIDLMTGSADADFRDAIIIVGETYAASQDRYDTPFADSQPGAVIHAEAVMTLMDGAELSRLPWWGVFASTAFGTLGAGLYALRQGIGRFLIVVSLVTLVCVGLTHLAFRSGLVLPWIWPSLGMLFIAPLLSYPLRMAEERTERLWARSQWGQMISEEFVERLEANRKAGLGSVESFSAAVLVLDLVDFSERTNRLSRDEIVESLNHVFERVVDLIRANNGTVLNFMGDAVIAMFHSKVDPSEVVASRALRTAQELVTMPPAAPQGQLAWECRVGLAFGEVTLALVGSKDRKQMTVYGSAVNLASRLEQAGKSLATSLVVHSRFAELLPDQVEEFEVKSVTPKGWDEPVNVMQLRSEPIGVSRTKGNDD